VRRLQLLALAIEPGALPRLHACLRLAQAVDVLQAARHLLLPPRQLQLQLLVAQPLVQQLRAAARGSNPSAACWPAGQQASQACVACMLLQHGSRGSTAGCKATATRPSQHPPPPSSRQLLPSPHLLHDPARLLLLPLVSLLQLPLALSQRQLRLKQPVPVLVLRGGLLGAALLALGRLPLLLQQLGPAALLALVPRLVGRGARLDGLAVSLQGLGFRV
jgi:hypothetical protein